MRRYTSEELFELAAGYALGATTEEESAAVEAALPESPELQAEVASFLEVTVALARSRAAAPPPAIRDRLVARVHETPRAPAVRTDGAVVPITAAASARRVERVERSARPWAWAVGIAAALLLAAGLGYENVRLRRSVESQGAEIAQLTEKTERRERQLDAVLTAEKDLYVAQMKGADTLTGPGIQFFWNAKQGRAILHAFRLRPAPAGRSYQLWLIQDGKPVSAKVFNSDADGHALVENIDVPRTPNGVTQVLLTEEPAGGSPLPTTKPFLGGALAKT